MRRRRPAEYLDVRRRRPPRGLLYFIAGELSMLAAFALGQAWPW